MNEKISYFKITLFFLVLSFLSSSIVSAKLVHYELVATRGKVNLSGKKEIDFALMLNGSIPAPTLEFTEGDEAEIVVHNKIEGEELSLHWHGILLPVEMDGVPYVTTPPIYSGQSYTFRFPLRQSGTYWYHSHTNVQEQKGLYGAFVIHPKGYPKNQAIKVDREITLVLSDWSDENATQILKNLRKDGDYYLFKKNTVRSWLGALQSGGLMTFLSNEWTRMGGMDVSDVGYDAFLINGKKEIFFQDLHPGQKVRLRLINASASSYLYVALGNQPLKVVSADGVDIEPVHAKELLMGMAETYDVVFEATRAQTELRISAQDGTGFASAWLGSGEKVLAPVKSMPNLYAPMNHAGHGGHADHGMHTEHMDHMDHMDHHAHQSSPHAIDTLTVDQIKAQRSTSFLKNQSKEIKEVKLVLGGDMSRYVWHINGKAIFEDRTIEIQEGDVIRFTLENQTMMHHPMHLHGHFFRVLNSFGDFSPLKHTVDVPPHGTRVIEFMANEPGEWMLHCHNLYHLKNGMARVVKYSSYTPKKEIAHFQQHDPHLHDHWYYYGMLEAASNHAQVYARGSQTWNQLEGRFETRNTTGKNFSYNEDWEYEADLFYRRWFNSYLNLIGGGTVFDKKISGTTGIGYLLPFLIKTDVLVTHRGKFRLNLEKKFQWTSHFYTDIDFTWRPNQGKEIAEDAEFEVTLMYQPNWNWSAGLMLTDDNIGFGVQVQF